MADDDTYLIGGDYGDKMLQWGDEGPYLVKPAEKTLIPAHRQLPPSSSQPKAQQAKPRPLTYDEMVKQLQDSVNRAKAGAESAPIAVDVRPMATTALEKVRSQPKPKEGPTPEELNAEADNMLRLLSIQGGTEAPEYREVQVDTDALDRSYNKMEEDAYDARK